MWVLVALVKIIFECAISISAIYIVCNNLLCKLMKRIDILDALSIYTSALILKRVFEMFQ